MFRAPLCPPSGAHDDSFGYHIGRLVLELLLDERFERHSTCLNGGTSAVCGGNLDLWLLEKACT